MIQNLKCLNCKHNWREQIPEGGVIRFDGSLVRTFVDPIKSEYANQTKDSYALFCPVCHQSVITVVGKL